MTSNQLNLKLRVNSFLFVALLLCIQGCSGESENSQLISAQSNNEIYPSTTTMTSTLPDPVSDEPEFLFDEKSNGQLSTDWRADLLAELRVEPPDFDTLYVREEWGPGWIDHDYNCINTRHEVLIEESLEETIFDDRGCKVIEGKWYDYYSDQFYEDPSDLDIDHMVPLHNAHISGASNWPLETKISFYNDLNDPQHLISVSSSANRSKGSRGPEVWKPLNENYWCQYAYSWIEIKARWNLSISEIEFAALDEMLGFCNGLPEMTYWFSNWLLRDGAMSSQDMSLTENEEESELQESIEETVNMTNG